MPGYQAYKISRPIVSFGHGMVNIVNLGLEKGKYTGLMVRYLNLIKGCSFSRSFVGYVCSVSSTGSLAASSDSLASSMSFRPKSE